MNALGRFKGLTTALVGALVLCAVLDVVALISDESYRMLLQRAIAGGVSVQQADSADHRQALIALWQVAALVFAGVLFLIWFRRAYVNVRSLGVGGLRYGSGWAVGAWFVPFLNLVRPKAIADDIWRGSDPELAAEATLEPAAAVPWYFNVWWGALIISNIAGRIAYSSVNNADTLSSLKTSTMLLLASDAVDLIAAAAAIAVVVDIFRRQRERRSSIGSAVAMA